MSRKTWIIVILLVAIAVSTYFYFVPPSENIYFSIAWLGLSAILLWYGNIGLSRLLNKWIPWLKYGKRRFFLHLFLGITFSVNIVNLVYLILKYGFTNEPPTMEQMVLTNIYGSIIFIPAFSIYFSLQFLAHWQSSELEMEKYHKESMRSQLKNLKNHLDPHFLFNNLNILSALIDTNPKQSQEFLVRFAQVYRTMLLNKVEDLITLEEELEFIQSYVYLIETRFEENILFDINIDEEAYMCMMPPLTLQMLIENAIKHNIISASRPLKINIRNEDCRLIIENSIYEKPEDIKTKSGTGLNNIKQRISYYTDEIIDIEKDDKIFKISIPLIEIETI
ncbi:MAG: histidine kinase [Cyclobacteriaceae bacterium]